MMSTDTNESSRDIRFTISQRGPHGGMMLIRGNRNGSALAYALLSLGWISPDIGHLSSTIEIEMTEDVVGQANETCTRKIRKVFSYHSLQKIDSLFNYFSN